MKKLFTMLVVSFCGTMAYAQSGAISVNDVSIMKGSSTQMEVTVNNAASNTAFQFDLKLPAGVSVVSATMNDGAVESNATDDQSRKLLHKLYTESDNVYRFLSYDNANAALTDGKVSITLEATNEAETAEVEIAGSDILVVNPEGTSTTQENGDIASITVSEGVSISIGKSGATTYVPDVALDFTDSKMSAYVVTGAEPKSFWLARIDKVPAGTPIYVKAPKEEAEAEGYEGNSYVVATTTLPNTYFMNFMIGNSTDAAVSITPEEGYNYYFLGSKGFTPFTEARNIGAHKAYVRVEKLPAAKMGSNQPLKIGDALQTTLCADADLDFSDQANLKAYIVIGYEKGSLWLAPVSYASAGTPLYLKGPKDDGYSITSKEVQVDYANMLVGNNTDEAITIQPTDGEYSNFFVGSKGFTPVTAARSNGAHKSYLQVLTSYIPTASSRGLNEGMFFGDKVAEILKVAIVGGEGDATGISRVAVEASNDTWYNLSGKRIDAPTKKGLYIKNGKKVIVK